ncbi:hypothetical protein [Nonomuraea sp. 10N515B]|uniref:hypothetical protein n=1 Tax=Nonomuraea sp. 10N515B TaxID=3457422 RepID=UPI003FCE974F
MQGCFPEQSTRWTCSRWRTRAPAARRSAPAGPQRYSLTRQGTTARLQWTVRNVGKNNAPLYDKLGKDVFDHTVSKVRIVFDGLPQDAEKVDVNLGPLGVIKNVAVTSV